MNLTRYQPEKFCVEEVFHKTSRNFHNAHFKRGHAVAQLVEALRYKSEGRGFYSRWCH